MRLERYQLHEERRTKSEDCEADELVKFMSTRTNPLPYKYEKVATRQLTRHLSELRNSSLLST